MIEASAAIACASCNGLATNRSDIVAVFESASPSFAFQVNESDVVNDAPGVYVHEPDEQSSSVPCVGGLTMVNVSRSPSASIAGSVMLTGATSRSSRVELFAAGAWLGVTLIVTVAVLESARPSLAFQVNESGPV